MQLRLAFATSVLVDPDILIVDEVLAVGDVNFQKKCLDTIMSFKKRGKAIIFVSHSMTEVSKFCDTVMFLKEGKVGKIGSPAESIAAYQDYLAKHPGINPKENLSDSI
jgi:ABC-type polysaccharide/polyol phosphate transport system ATPase subunit